MNDAEVLQAGLQSEDPETGARARRLKGWVEAEKAVDTAKAALAEYEQGAEIASAKSELEYGARQVTGAERALKAAQEVERKAVVASNVAQAKRQILVDAVEAAQVKATTAAGRM